MKKILSLLVLTQVLLTLPISANADTRVRIGINLNFNDLFGSSAYDRQRYQRYDDYRHDDGRFRQDDHYYQHNNRCMNQFECGDQYSSPITLQIDNRPRRLHYHIDSRPGAIVRGSAANYPGTPCRGYTKVFVENGQPLFSARAVSCVINGRWVEVRDSGMFNPHPTCRDWRQCGNDIPLVTAPIEDRRHQRPIWTPNWGAQQGPPCGVPGRPPCFQQQPPRRWDAPPSGPIHGGQPVFVQPPPQQQCGVPGRPPCFRQPPPQPPQQQCGVPGRPACMTQQQRPPPLAPAQCGVPGRPPCRQQGPPPDVLPATR